MTLFTAIRPSRAGTRILTTKGDEIRLKAKLSRPHHPHALRWLLEALSLWEGERGRAALCVDDRAAFSGTDFPDDWLFDFGGPLYELDVVRASALTTRLRDRVGGGLGSFADLRQLRLFSGGGR